MKLRLPLAIAALGALLQVGANAGGPPPVSFRRDVAPVITTSCTTSSCHGGGSRPPVLEPHGGPAALRAALVGVASEQRPSRFYVRPGDPGASYLMQKLEGHLNDAECIDHDCGLAMPMDNPSLSAEARDKVRTWISQGALDN
jgi:hypothetical protein